MTELTRTLNRSIAYYTLHSELLEEDEMAQQKSKEPCKKEACDIQACLTKNNFDSRRCLKVIELLQSCCEKCSYKSTHCASVSALLKNSSK